MPASWKVLLLGLLFVHRPEARAQVTLVEEGQPKAEIIIAEKPPRSVRVAAQELQDHLLQISGARLAIRTRPTAGVAKVYVGESAGTRELNLSTEGLQHGAYRIATGADWLALLGDDTDFVPVEPWARNNNDVRGGTLQAAWNKITGHEWGAPSPGMYKNKLKLPGTTGKPEGVLTEKNEVLEIWSFDERGSHNAVCGLLRRLGVRWYLPGELGTVLPKLKTITLPAMDEVTRPDFAMRRFNIRFGVTGLDTAMWAMRLGLRDPQKIEVAHGMETMTGRDEIFALHPDWFALYGGRRHYRAGESKNQLCYSNPELFKETVMYARALFDHYQLETVSIMPPDGYTSICQCADCRGKDDLARADRGHLSDYVWDFVNRVARETGKTHPGKRILCCAYGAYTSPPLKIAKLEPNVQVCIVGGRRPTSNLPAQQAEIAKLRADWAAKTNLPLMVFENYPFTDRGWYLPAFVHRSIGSSVNATKGVSEGEDIWLSIGQDFASKDIGFNHFMVYFTARMYWGGKDADVDAMFREYCRLFYGPAGDDMLRFFNHSEVNWQAMEKDKAKADEALALFAAAQKAAPQGSVYARRLALVDRFLDGLRRKSSQLGRQRGPVPNVRLVGDAKGVVIDGSLDDAYWQNCPVAATTKLREIQTGRTPAFATTVKAGWQAGSLCFAIRCEEARGEEPNDTSVKEDDAALWLGDCVEILLETESRSYYQIAVSPSGIIADMDRSAGRTGAIAWDSKAEVATQKGDGHWTVEIRIPVTEDENDPLHQVIGSNPTQSLPWFINVCRQRVREDGQEHSAISPTGVANFHAPMKFARLYDGRSHTFEAAAPEPDFLEALGRKDFEQAASLATTDVQKAHALELLYQKTGAEEVLAQIPVPAVKKAAQMQTWLTEGVGGATRLTAAYAEEDMGAWPFWKRGDGLFARGRAWSMLREGARAEKDLSAALAWTQEPRTRVRLLLALAHNREMNLKQDAAALQAYQELLGDARQVGGADEFTAVQGAARLLARTGQTQEALAVLALARVEELKGVWRGNLLLSTGDVHLAAGDRARARASYEAVLQDPAQEERLKKLAREKLAGL